MKGTISEEMEVKVQAGEAWKVYGSLKLAEIVGQELPHVVHKLEVVQGDGGVGTIVKITFPPGTPAGFTCYNEKFTVIDNEKRVKETEAVEGGYLDLGFTLYRIRFQVMEKGENCCITRSTIEYEVKDEAAENANAVSIQPLLVIMNTVAAYLTKSNKT